MKKTTTINMILSALFIALGIVLPMAFHSLGMAGTIFLPMHIPVLLCGFICGWRYGVLAGIITPLLSSIFTGMPPLYPVGVSMCIELATYGGIAGFLSSKTSTIVSLIGAMLVGRVAAALANIVLLSLAGNSFVLQAFLTSTFVTALPGILIQLILIPAIMLGLKKSNILNKVMTA